jgi:hypothetical protein
MGKSRLETFITSSCLADPNFMISSSDNPTTNCPLITPTVAGVAPYLKTTFTII